MRHPARMAQKIRFAGSWINPFGGQAWWALLVLGLAALAVSGCRSVGVKGGSTVSLEVTGRTPDEIRDTTAQVFREHGYEVSLNSRAALSFVKRASKMDNWTYGSPMDPVWIHVEAAITPAPTGFKVQCRVRLVQGRGLLEEELKQAHPNMAPYQKLLDEIGNRLAVR
jgi:hypothetical protein